MTDIDPEIWNNPTLGAEGAGPFLPELEAQAIEDANARRDGREPQIVEYVHRYPKFTDSGSVPSIQADLVYMDTADAYGHGQDPRDADPDDYSVDLPNFGDNTIDAPSE